MSVHLGEVSACGWLKIYYKLVKSVTKYGRRGECSGTVCGV